MKRRIFTPLLLLSGLALSGCGLMPWSVTAQVPTDSSVRQGEVSGSDQQDQFIRVIPQGPRSGMTAVQVVQGFLDASAAAEDDHGVAREYLTAEAAARWMPDSGVQVFKGVNFDRNHCALLGSTCGKDIRERKLCDHSRRKHIECEVLPRSPRRAMAD